MDIYFANLGKQD